MNRRILLALSGSTFVLTLPGGSVQAQTYGTTAPAVYADDIEYRLEPIEMGSVNATIGTDIKFLYDSNIFAVPSGSQDDAIGIIAPFVQLDSRSGPVAMRFLGHAEMRRFADHSSENSEAFGLSGNVDWQIARGEAFRFGLSWQRDIEDRGDPEARNPPSLGPRQIDIAQGTIGYRRARGKMLLDLEGGASRNNARAAVDDNRDFSSYRARGTVGYRASGSLFATATVFANRREFRLPYTTGGDKRNSTTYGGRLGIDIEPGGLIEGSISAGIFRFDPDEQTYDGRTGLSLAGSMIYRPTRRAALVLELFNGDVATFRNGATGRTDTTAQLGWQHEIRHNLYSNLSVGYRRTKYAGTGIVEKTATARGELELLLSRNISAVANISYGDRSSTLPTEEFSRFRTSLGLRMRF
ncbi:MAG: outer membrane beta-barrel protein [Sphingomonadaceae bacterium]